MSDVRNKLLVIISDQLGIEQDDVKDDMVIKEDLDADSLDVVEIIMHVEEEFDVDIDDDTANDLTNKTVKELIAFIDENKPAE